MEPIVLTAAVAQRWLLRQTPHQRHEEHHREQIERYAGRMRGGYWLCTGRDPVKFTDEGFLVDGRCRLHAVTLARVPVRLHVVGWVFGPFPEEQIA